jgi:hypothetical protein
VLFVLAERFELERPREGDFERAACGR